MLSAPHGFQQNKIRPLRNLSLEMRAKNIASLNDLLNLQPKQLVHDANYHQDICRLPYTARINHMVLHFAKYAGKFLSAEEHHDRQLLIATLVDTWIITMASANILNLRLSESLGLEDQGATTLSPSLQRMAAEFGPEKDPYFLALRHLGKTAGLMTKACEATDHGEPFDSRGTLERGVIHIAKLSIVLAHQLAIDLAMLVQKRWTDIEARSIL